MGQNLVILGSKLQYTDYDSDLEDDWELRTISRPSELRINGNEGMKHN